MEKCIADVRSWMINDKLMLNDDKTELLVIGTSKQLSEVSVSGIRVGDVDIIPVYSAKNLGLNIVIVIVIVIVIGIGNSIICSDIWYKYHE